MAITVKEIKEDALIEIKVNKNFYLMSKDALYTIFLHLMENENEKQNIDNLFKKKFEELESFERAFYTITLLISEIEKQVQNNSDLYTEKEIPEPGDPDYIEPKQD